MGQEGASEGKSGMGNPATEPIPVFSNKWFWPHLVERRDNTARAIVGPHLHDHQFSQYMDPFILVLLAATAAYIVHGKQQRQRSALLSEHLQPFQVEKQIETLTQGYLRAMGEQDDERRRQILSLLEDSEQVLVGQFGRFCTSFQKVSEPQARVSRLPVSLPFATQLLASNCFDMRQMLSVHGKGLERVARNDAALSPRDKAFMMTAEILLMQHSCHWFCKSKSVASARMLARNKTPHEQLVQSVSPETRAAYKALVG